MSEFLTDLFTRFPELPALAQEWMEHHNEQSDWRVTKALREQVAEAVDSRRRVLAGELVSYRPALAKDQQEAERARVHFIAGLVPYMDQRALLFTLGSVVVDDRPTDYVQASDLERDIMEPAVALRVLEGALERLGECETVDTFRWWHVAASDSLIRSNVGAETYALFQKSLKEAVGDSRVDEGFPRTKGVTTARLVLEAQIRHLRVVADAVAACETEDAPCDP